MSWWSKESWRLESIIRIAGDFIRDLIALESGGSGGVVWRIRSSPTKLVITESRQSSLIIIALLKVCAVGSRNGTEETKLLVLDFDAEVSDRDSCPELVFINVDNLGEVTNRSLSSREERYFPDNNSGHIIVK